MVRFQDEPADFMQSSASRERARTRLSTSANWSICHQFRIVIEQPWRKLSKIKSSKERTGNAERSWTPSFRTWRASFERLVSGSLWHSVLAAIDVRDRGNLPIALPEFSDIDLPQQVRFQATAFDSLIPRSYVAPVYSRR